MVELRKSYSRPNEFGSVSNTARSEEVKSRKEKQIADYFTENGVRYEYEEPPRANGKIRRIYAMPDFYLPDYGVHVEYWGLVYADDGYVEKMQGKMARYHRSGVKFISLFPEDMKNLDSVFRSRFKAIVGLDLPKPIVRSRIHYCPSCGAPPATSTAKFCGKCGRKFV